MRCDWWKVWSVPWCNVRCEMWCVAWCSERCEMWCVVWCSVRCGVWPGVTSIVSHCPISDSVWVCRVPGSGVNLTAASGPHHHALLQCTLLQCCTTPTQTVHTKPDIWTHDVMYTTVQCALCSSYCNCGGDTGQEVTVGLHSGWWVVCEWWWLMVVSEWWHAAGSQAPAAWPGLVSAP